MDEGVAGPPAWTVAPDPGQESFALIAPPRLSDSPAMTGSAGMILVPAASGLGAVVLAVTHQDRPLIAVAGLLVLAASIAAGLIMVISSRTGARRRTREQRERYLDYLEAGAGSGAGSGHGAGPSSGGGESRPGRRGEHGLDSGAAVGTRPGRSRLPGAASGARHGAAGRRADCAGDEDDPLVVYDPVCLTAAQDLARRYTDAAGSTHLRAVGRGRCADGGRGAGPGHRGDQGRCWPN